LGEIQGRELPLVTLKIVAAIHWQALRLRLKGARLVPRPAAGSKALNTSLAIRERIDYSGSALSVRGSALWSGESRS
jgi:hypothetical protein